jgi:hypothetical protein
MSASELDVCPSPFIQGCSSTTYQVPSDLSPTEILSFMLDAEDAVYTVFQGEHSRYMVAKQAFEENIGRMREAFHQAFAIAQQHGNQISDDIVKRANERELDPWKKSTVSILTSLLAQPPLVFDLASQFLVLCFLCFLFLLILP